MNLEPLIEAKDWQEWDAILRLASLNLHEPASRWQVLDNLPAKLEDCLKRALRPHDEAGFTAKSDRWMIALRRALDNDLDLLTLREVETELRLPHQDTLPPEVETALKCLLKSQAFLRYLNAYLYFGIRFMANRSTWSVSRPRVCSDANVQSLPLRCPPDLCLVEADQAHFRSFPLSGSIKQKRPYEVALALAFLDDFKGDFEECVNGELGVQLQLDEPGELELWLRGLRPELEPGSPASERFKSIRDGLSEWAKERSNFYLSLEPATLIKVQERRDEVFDTRPAEGWIVSHPMAARIALLDIYWIARLLRADVSETAWVRYNGANWLQVLRFDALLRKEDEEARLLSKAEEALRSVFDLVCDLIQNSVELTRESAQLAAESKHKDVPPPPTSPEIKKWRAVFDAELDEIERQRTVRRFIDPSMPRGAKDSAQGQHAGADVPVDACSTKGWSKWITTGQRPRNLIGLAFSGGGVRSATVSLGVLQGLQELDMLRHVDYMSSVSGGGFSGAWLVANVYRSTYWLGRLTPWSDSVRHLRNYSNYLIPRSGLLSADTWNLGVSWFRNAFLIQLTGLASLFVLLVSVLLAFQGFHLLLTPVWWKPVPVWWKPSLVAVVAALIASFALYRLQYYVAAAGDPAVRNAPTRKVRHIVGAAWISSGLFTAHLWSIAWNCQTFLQSQPEADRYSHILLSGLRYWWAALLLSVVACTWLAWRTLIVVGIQRSYGRKFRSVWVAVFCACVLHLAISAVFYLFRTWCVSFGAHPERAEGLAFVTGPALILASYSLCLLLHIGLIGRFTTEALREWWTRFGTWVGIVAGLGLCLTATAVFAPDLVTALLRSSHENHWLSSIKWTAVGGWFMTIVGGLFAGQSSKTEGNKNVPKSPGLESLAQLGGLLFLITTFMLGSTLLCLLLFEFSGVSDPQDTIAQSATVQSSSEAPPVALTHVIVQFEPPPSTANELDLRVTSKTADPPLPKAKPTSPSFLQTESAQLYVSIDRSTQWWLILACWPAASFLLWLFSRYFEINIFGLSQFYRNRLVRAYLGATRWEIGKREPDPFTKFDFSDDLDLAAFRTFKPDSPTSIANEKKAWCGPFRGPFPLFNCSLNLAGSGDLSLHTRHSASFTLTPLFCGSDRLKVGYAPTENYAGGIRTGQAVAISGAAVSSNMGYSTSPLVAYLLTMFNVRLGWWFPNPSKGTVWKSRGITSSILPLLAELFGIADEKRSYVNVSDGGHFENLGIYELLRRRCKLIIACDAECDENLEFGGLGNLLRIAQTDFGAMIEVDVKSIRQNASGFSHSHAAIGMIKYCSGEIGWLIYLKASVTGDEGVGIAQYRSTHPSFPHQTTADQFFTEDQFESYRSLGLHMMRSAFKGTVPGDDPLMTVDRLWDMLTPVACPESAFLKHTASFSALLEKLRLSPSLGRFCDELLMVGTKRPVYALTREELVIAMELIQLMEDVFLDLRLDDLWEHPDNRGWVIMFMRWARSPRFRLAWKQSHRTFGIRFEHFCSARLGLERDHPIVRV